jgi:hypothetical protein
MQLTRRLLAIAAVCALAIAALAQQKRSITEKDIFQFNWIGDPQISPDGSRNQLLLAERSPVRRAYKQKDQPSHSGQRSQTLLPAELVTGGEGRDLLSNGRASLRNWSGGAAGLRIESRRNQELPRKEEDGPESDIPERFTGNTGDAHDFLFCSPKMSCPGQNYEANRGAGNVRPVIYL